MFKVRVILLGVLAISIMSGIAVSSASASGPYWRVNGSRLGQGAIKQIKFQLKGSTVLNVPEAGIEIECKNSVSEGGTIEGQGEKQGQGKVRLAFTQCKVVKPATGCKIVEPITTNPLKSYLATIESQPRIVTVFEPGQGNVWFVLKVTGTCLQAGTYEVSGGAAAEIIPSGVEGQEGLMVFPGIPIEEVKHEGVAKAIKLKISGFISNFNAIYGDRLEGKESFGVFET